MQAISAMRHSIPHPARAAWRTVTSVLLCAGLAVAPGAAGEIKTTDLFNECRQDTVDGDLVSGGETTFTLRAEDRDRRRCEIAVHHHLRADHTTVIAFQFRLASDWPRHDDRWAAIFQIHSFADKGEGAKCPIMALEVIGSRARAFNRWDASPISDTAQGPCADRSTTIKSRPLFQDVPLDVDRWTEVKIVYRPSLAAEGRIAVSIARHQVADAKGPNMYNDQRGPYLKFGVYKPTGWTQAGPYTISYRNISVVAGED
jgi:hypothetical protein